MCAAGGLNLEMQRGVQTGDIGALHAVLLVVPLLAGSKRKARVNLAWVAE